MNFSKIMPKSIFLFTFCSIYNFCVSEIPYLITSNKKWFNVAYLKSLQSNLSLNKSELYMSVVLLNFRILGK